MIVRDWRGIARYPAIARRIPDGVARQHRSVRHCGRRRRVGSNIGGRGRWDIRRRGGATGACAFALDHSTDHYRRHAPALASSFFFKHVVARHARSVPQSPCVSEAQGYKTRRRSCASRSRVHDEHGLNRTHRSSCHHSTPKRTTWAGQHENSIMRIRRAGQIEGRARQV